MKATVFLGGGRITGALAAGLRLAGDRREIIVYDRHPEKLQALRRESNIKVARDLKSAIERATILIIAVRPVSVKEMLREVAARGGKPSRLCISLAAGVPIRNLRTWLPGSLHWVRAMPSPVCRIGRGLTPISLDRAVTGRERQIVRNLFEPVGPVLEMPEAQLDAMTAASSPTHGYHALAHLARAAQKAGLDQKTAFIAAAHALSDSIVYWRGSGAKVEELLHEAATPGGIAAATMTAMDKSGYARAVDHGIRAGVKQCAKNARR
jgi:pyrroline-5-carboxylate reductase